MACVELNQSLMILKWIIRHFTPRKYWLITQEAVAPSRHDWKIVDWDVKPQHKQHKQIKWIILSPTKIKGNFFLRLRKVQSVPQSQTAVNPWHQEEEKYDKN